MERASDYLGASIMGTMGLFMAWGVMATTDGFAAFGPARSILEMFAVTMAFGFGLAVSVILSGRWRGAPSAEWRSVGVMRPPDPLLTAEHTPTLELTDIREAVELPDGVRKI